MRLIVFLNPRNIGDGPRVFSQMRFATNLLFSAAYGGEPDRRLATSEYNLRNALVSVAIWRNYAHAVDIVGPPPEGAGGRETNRAPA
jgi:hypothetical protein